MMGQRALNENEQAELDRLNEDIDQALRDRCDWLDAKMVETSPLQVGDEIYDLDTGSCLGRVTQLYRYWRDRERGILDTLHYCDYEYESSPGIRRNTSSQSGRRSFGTREEALRRAESLASALRSGER